jgi:chromosomal replication initiator protein
VDDSVDIVAVWNRVKHRFDDPSVRPQQKAWIGLTRPLGLVEDTVLLAAPNDFAKDFLENRLRQMIAKVLSEELDRDIQVAVTVQSGEAKEPMPDPVEAEGLTTDEDDWQADPPRPASATPTYRPKHSDDERDREARLNPKYTFETFVIGSSNRFTHAAAVAVAEAPARAYNPLFIYGDSGLGKTHLLHAIGHYAQRLQPGLRTRYVSSEEFTNDFINSVRDDKMQAFQSRYRSVDVLLIDDIQFMEGKESTKEEFFHTFNALHGASRQIVITSDRPPKSLAALEDRLRSRFEWGLVTDVQPPALETRLAILRKKAEREPVPVPDEVLEFIASNVRDNIRILEGALIRVTAFASLNQQQLDETLAQQVLHDLFAGDQPQQITAKAILDATCRIFGFSLEELCGPNRRRPLVTARQIAMYVMRELTDFSYPAIAREFGGRDHTTVIHAVEKIGDQMKERRAIYDQVNELIGVIKRGS